MNYRTSLIAILGALFLLAASPLNDEERAVEKLKWSELVNVHWTWDENFYQVEFNDEQKKLDGKTLIVEGYMFPLEFTRKHSNFLVSSAPMSDCFFCGPGEAESMVYVQMSDPIDYTHRPIQVKGTFKLVTDASQGIIYELIDAESVK